MPSKTQRSSLDNYAALCITVNDGIFHFQSFDRGNFGTQGPAQVDSGTGPFHVDDIFHSQVEGNG